MVSILTARKMRMECDMQVSRQGPGWEERECRDASWVVEEDWLAG
jgi:hypothetical protein